MSRTDQSGERRWPRKFGKYELLRRIGAGGMAEVFLARSFGAEGLQKELVIKRILPEYAQRRRFVSMFIDEAKLAVSLNHPNIVQTYDFGRVDDDYFIAMEFVDGIDLARLLSRLRPDGSVPLGDAIYVAVELCKGLDYAHRRTDKFGDALGLVHRDISPQNILVSREGNLKIVDFGIAHARNVSAERPGLIKGKYSYMSPEQATGMQVDHRSDIFSAAVVLFELVYGRPLFRFTTSEETLDLVKQAVIPDLHDLDESVPSSVERILYRALERQPAKRYPSARDLQVDLHRVLIEIGEIHDAQTLAAFVEATFASAAAEPERESADEVRTVVQAAESQTPSLSESVAGLQVSRDDSQSGSTSVVGQLTPATPAIYGTQGGNAELRHTKKDVICVSGHITGFEAVRAHSADRQASLLLELMRIVEAIAFKNGGIVEHFTETRFLLLLGLPVSSENDAERAVWMGLDLLEAVAGINLNLDHPIHVSVGVALGRARVERTGPGTFTRELLGQVRDLAHQIATEAMPREILVGGRIYQRVRRTFELDFLKQVRFEEDEREGHSNPSVYRVLRPKSRKERQAELRESFGTLYGRDLALKHIREAFTEVQVAQHCRGFAFEGDTGMGKSSAVDEFVRGLEVERLREAGESALGVREGEGSNPNGPRSFVILRALATQHERDTPLSTLRELVYDLLELDPDDDIRAIKATIDRTVDRHFPDVEDEERNFLTHSIGFFFDVKYPRSTVDALNAARRRARLFLSVRRLLERVARTRSVVAVVEDVQDCDASSVEFLADLLGDHTRRPIFLVMTVRPLTETTPALERLLFNESVQIETLGELSRRDATALVRERLGDVDIERVALDYILERAGGVPLFIAELVDALRARGVLQLVNDRYTLGGSAHETWLPTSLEAVVAARIDELEPTLKAVLRNVAVLGAEFERRDAKFLLGEEVVDDLERLTILGWLRRVRARTSDAAGYRFTHTLTYEVAFRELIWEERQEQHARLADHLLAEVEAGRRQADLATIARHLEGARRHDEAARHYHLAAAHAQRANSHVEALRMINRALDLCEPDSRARFSALGVRERALAALGHSEERLEVLEEMHRFASAALTELEQIDVLNKLAEYWIDLRDFERARGYLDAVIAQTAEDHHLTRLSVARKLSAMVERESGNAAAAIELLGEALIGFHHGNERAQAARTSKIIGDTYWQMGRFDDALEAYQDALSATTEDDRDLQEVIAVNIALVRVSLGQYKDALDQYRAALRSCRTVGFTRREAAILPNLGHLYLLLGEPRRAERTLHRAVRIARRIRDPLVLCDALLTLAVVQLDRRRFDRVERTLEEGRRLAVDTEIDYLHIHADLAFARLYLGRSDDMEDASQAAEHAAKAIARGRAAAMIHGTAHGEHLRSLALERLGRSTEALDAAARAREIVDRHIVDGREILRSEQAALVARLAPEEDALVADLRRRARADVESAAASLPEEARANYLGRQAIAAILGEA